MFKMRHESESWGVIRSLLSKRKSCLKLEARRHFGELKVTMTGAENVGGKCGVREQSDPGNHFKDL